MRDDTDEDTSCGQRRRLCLLDLPPELILQVFQHVYSLVAWDLVCCVKTVSGPTGSTSTSTSSSPILLLRIPPLPKSPLLINRSLSHTVLPIHKNTSAGYTGRLIVTETSKVYSRRRVDILFDQIAGFWASAACPAWVKHQTQTIAYPGILHSYGGHLPAQFARLCRAAFPRIRAIELTDRALLPAGGGSVSRERARRELLHTIRNFSNHIEDYCPGLHSVLIESGMEVAERHGSSGTASIVGYDELGSDDFRWVVITQAVSKFVAPWQAKNRTEDVMTWRINWNRVKKIGQVGKIK